MKIARPGKQVTERIAPDKSLVRLRQELLRLNLLDKALTRTDSGLDAGGELPLVISLTTYRPRIDNLHLTIESLFQQSRRAARIILWLSRQEFSEADIPALLRRQCERGLEIVFCEDNLGSYKKIHYALQQYSDCPILTVDDDIMYPADMVDQLLRAYEREPGMIHCTRAHQIRFDAKGRLQPYKTWIRDSDTPEPSLLLMPTGAGGVLYFPGCFDPEVVNREAFMQLAPNADDIWLKAMSFRRGVSCAMVPGYEAWMERYVSIPGSQRVSLKRRNKDPQAGNDTVFRRVFEQYGLMERLLETAGQAR